MKLLCLGEALIDFLDEGDGHFLRQAGGAPMNVACAAAKFGVSSGLITKLGDDIFGRYLHDILRSHNVDTTCATFTKAAPTGLAFVSLAADGDRDFAFYRTPCADSTLGKTDIPDFAGVDILHFGSISLIDEPSRSATHLALQKARAAGTLISYDPNLRLALWQSEVNARRQILSVLPLCDIVKVSREEVAFLGIAAKDLGPAIAIESKDKDGATLFAEGKSTDVGAFDVDVRDTTGAGDAFIGGFLSYLLRAGTHEYQTLVEALRYGNAAAALCCTAHGAIAALPSKDDVEALLG